MELVFTLGISNVEIELESRLLHTLFSWHTGLSWRMSLLLPQVMYSTFYFWTPPDWFVLCLIYAKYNWLLTHKIKRREKEFSLHIISLSRGCPLTLSTLPQFNLLKTVIESPNIGFRFQNFGLKWFQRFGDSFPESKLGYYI